MKSASLRSFALSVLVLLSIASSTLTRSEAAIVEADVLDLRPVSPLTIHVTMKGELVQGDADRLSELLARTRRAGVRDILFFMDSPGGSLAEGLAIGRVIANLREITTAQVGWTEAPNAICASACALAYLGADYRYLAEEGRIGVHRFGAPGTEMDGEEALSFAQEVSAILTEYVRAQRADPAFYERMARTSFDGIDWVERSQLEEWRVVTGPVYNEKVEYRNVNGSVALYVAQTSLYGDNSLTLTCGGSGLVGIAALNKPEVVMYGRLELAVDGGELLIDDYDIVDGSGNFATAIFAIPPAYAPHLAAARTFGARILLPSEVGFFGFEMRIRDGKLREMVEGCRPATSSAGVTSTRTRGMKPLKGIDYPGGDMTSAGLRGIDLGTCLSICETDRSCLAVSYVTDKRWCWPKSRVGTPVAAPGITSATK